MVWSRGNALGIFVTAAERRMIMTEFISRKYGKEGYEIIVKTDNHEHYRATEDFARRLIDHAKPMSNADCIRAMSDKELAQEMIFFCPTDTVFKGTETYEKPHYTGLDGHYYSTSEELTAANIVWLKQPAEEEMI